VTVRDGLIVSDAVRRGVNGKHGPEVDAATGLPRGAEEEPSVGIL
jgi:hypothetical protein